jgi:FkbM family methyltransferase
MWFWGVYEPIESFLFSQLLQPGMVVIDVGANVGQYSMLAATAVGTAGSVHSFEPVPSNFVRLDEHIADNKLQNVYLNKAAHWHEETTVTLGLPLGMINNAGAYSIGAGPDRAFVVEAEALTLDHYATRCSLSRVDMMKMDIEGAEPAAIAGGLQVIKEYRPLIFAEVCRTALSRAGFSTAALWESISRLGYRAWRIGQSPETSGPVHNLESLVQTNVLFHYSDLPRSITSEWTLRAALRWARSRL